MRHEIIISNTTELFRVSADDVMAFRARGNYTVAVLNDGQEHVLSYQLGLLSEIVSEQLGADGDLFIRVGRSITINREYVFIINLPERKLELRSPQGKKVSETISKEALAKLKMIIELKNEKGGSHDADRQNE